MISIIVDTETTGLDPSYDRIVELSMIIFNQKASFGILSTYINPQMNFENSVNGLCLRDVVESPTFEELCNLGLPFLLSIADEFIGHNLDFDLRFLKAEFSRLELQFPVRQSYDTFRVIRKNLREACEVSRINTEDINWHTALGDAIATWRLARRLRSGKGLDTPQESITLGVRLT